MELNPSIVMVFLEKGGFFMYPILLCSVFALSISLYKMWTLRTKNILPDRFLFDFHGLLTQGKLGEAAAISQREDSSVSRIALVALSNSEKDRDGLREEIEEAGRREIQDMGRYVESLGSISNVSTLLGLLGTISGMIKIFNVIAKEPIVNQQTLAGGISEALYTTAFGLSVAIPAYLAYKYYSEKIEEFVTNLELESRKIMDQVLAVVGSKNEDSKLEGETGT